MQTRFQVFNHMLPRRDKHEYFPGNIRVHPTPGSAAPDQPAETLRKDGERASLFKQLEQLFAAHRHPGLLPVDN